MFRVQLPIFAFQFDIVSFEWKTEEGETEIIFVLTFVLWLCFNRQWFLYIVSTGHFHFLFLLAIAVQIFVPWKFIKT